MKIKKILIILRRTQQNNHLFTMALYRSNCVSRHLQLRTGGFCGAKASMPLQIATSAFRLRRRRWSSPYTHTRLFNGPFSGTTQVSQYQKGKTNLDFSEARDSGISWAICKSAPCSRQTTTAATSGHRCIPVIAVCRWVVICDVNCQTVSCSDHRRRLSVWGTGAKFSRT